MSKTSTNNELLLLINQLFDRVNVLEEKNIELTKKIENIQKVDNSNVNKLFKIITEKLEQKSPSMLLNDWIQHLFSFIPSKLETVFENDLIKGIQSILKESTDNIECLPICAFNKKKNMFYFYDNEKEKWEILENKKFDEIISRVCYRFLSEFKRCWYDVNIQKINTQEEYKNMYSTYYMKILGGDKISDEVLNNRIRKYFYDLIKENV